MAIDETYLAQQTPKEPGSDEGEKKVDRSKPPSVWRRFGLQIGIASVGVLIWLLFLISAPVVFLKPSIYIAFASTTPLFLIIALALTFVIITGEIDLSFPAVMALSMVSFTWVFQNGGYLGVAFLAAIVTGALAGVFNGYLVAKWEYRRWSLRLAPVSCSVGLSWLLCRAVDSH